MIEIYTKPNCPYCVKAISLFRSKGAPFKEIDITSHTDFVQEMLNRSGGRRTVPQIFINDIHIGGCDELYALDAKNQLDAILMDLLD